jgi:hypothetical protein
MKLSLKNFEVKFFFTFFFISFLFSYWTSWNEETNFVLIKAIVENGSFYLEKYRNITGDLNCLKEHCFAPLFRWVFSILGTPIYTFLKFLTNNKIFSFGIN